MIWKWKYFEEAARPTVATRCRHPHASKTTHHPPPVDHLPTTHSTTHLLTFNRKQRKAPIHFQADGGDVSVDAALRSAAPSR